MGGKQIISHGSMALSGHLFAEIVITVEAKNQQSAWILLISKRYLTQL